MTCRDELVDGILSSKRAPKRVIELLLSFLSLWTVGSGLLLYNDDLRRLYRL